MTPTAILSIAASDSFGAAGIQADIKTAMALHAYCATAITAVTAQNSLGVAAIHPVPANILSAQLTAAARGFLPARLGAIKIGMLGHAEALPAVVNFVRQLAGAIPVVVDTVLNASSGAALLPPSAVHAYRDSLLPLATLITPNLHEAALLLDAPLATSEAQQREQAQALLQLGCGAVLLKGGHFEGNSASDYLVTPHGEARFSSPKIQTNNSRGTGCSLAAAIAVGIAQGVPLEQTVEAAKNYISAALQGAVGWQLAQGSGPICHGANGANSASCQQLHLGQTDN